MVTKKYSEEELATYEFADVQAPEDFDPDAKGQLDPTPGKHRMKVRTYEVVPNEIFKWKQEQYILDQLRPVLECTDADKEPGASTMDFIPMPPRGNQQVPATGLLNRWANFIKSFGFDIPEGKVTPPGFRLDHLKNREAEVDIEYKVNQDTKEVVKKDNGKPRVQVAFFGYSRPDSTPVSTVAREAETGPAAKDDFKL